MSGFRFLGKGGYQESVNGKALRLGIGEIFHRVTGAVIDRPCDQITKGEQK